MRRADFVVRRPGRILAVPFIDFRQSPNGVDGTAGAQIECRGRTHGVRPRSCRAE